MSLKVKFVWLSFEFFAASRCRRFRRFLDHLCKGRNVYTQTSRLDAMKLSYIKEDAAHSRIDLKRKNSVHVLCVCIAWCKHEGKLGEFKTVECKRGHPRTVFCKISVRRSKYCRIFYSTNSGGRWLGTFWAVLRQELPVKKFLDS